MLNKRPEQPPLVDHPKIILFHVWLHHKIILAKPRPWAEFSCAGACGAWKFPTSACRRLPAAAWNYSRWMQRLSATLPHEY